MPWDTTSSRKYSTWMRFPKRRPCMSVNAVTTVSIAPSFASLRRSSRESMPAAPPGPPGRVALTPLLFRAAGRRGRCGRFLADLVDRPDRARVPVLGRHGPPDRHEQPDQEHAGRVVEGRRVEVVVPGDPG